MIICCYNSVSRLPATLDHLAGQQLSPGVQWEIIVVDNACTDGTSEYAIQYWRQLNAIAPLNLLKEPKQGTDHARRSGLMAANFQYFLFCDDDNWLAPNYVQKAYDYLNDHTEVGLLTGKSEAVADQPLPEWFRETAGYYAVGSLGEHEKDITHVGHWGAGMAGRTLPAQTAMIDTIPLMLAGRVGNNTGFGEDGEICMRVAMQGYRLMYTPTLKLLHFMAANRLTIAYRDQLLSNASRPAQVMASYFRWIFMAEHKKLSRWRLLLKQGIAYMIWSISLKKPLQQRSADFLYFACGLSMFRTDINSVVYNYGTWLKDNAQLRQTIAA